MEDITLPGQMNESIMPIPAPRGGKFLRFLFGTVFGRSLLYVLSSPVISNLAGKFLDSPASKALIPDFIERNGIDVSEFEPCKYRSFNDFFTRKILPEKRPVDPDPDTLIAPCDGLLSAYRITDGLVIPVKQSRYSIAGLLQNEELAERYNGGNCLVFRLRVDHYHRYCYPVDASKGPNVHLNGKLYTVRPVALRGVPVFTENAREFTVLDTERFGRIVQMEVGALLVGKIENFDGIRKYVCRGREKGTFLYGGSTVILLTEKDTVELPEEMFSATREGNEIPVRMGMAVGRTHCTK